MQLPLDERLRRAHDILAEAAVRGAQVIGLDEPEGREFMQLAHSYGWTPRPALQGLLGGGADGQLRLPLEHGRWLRAVPPE